jgi:hypothetical protein
MATYSQHCIIFILAGFSVISVDWIFFPAARAGLSFLDYFPCLRYDHVSMLVAKERPMPYQVYFDFHQSPFDWWAFWPGFVLVLIGVIWLTHTLKKKKSPTIALVFLFCQIIILLSFIFIAYDQFHYYTTKFNSHDYGIIEGIISNHQPVTFGDGGRETFEVNGMQFAFQGKGRPPIFNQTVAKGGKLHNGLPVRITFTGLYGYVPGWAILRIEIPA